jgi:hypothetical protein
VRWLRKLAGSDVPEIFGAFWNLLGKMKKFLEKFSNSWKNLSNNLYDVIIIIYIYDVHNSNDVI